MFCNTYINICRLVAESCTLRELEDFLNRASFLWLWLSSVSGATEGLAPSKLCYHFAAPISTIFSGAVFLLLIFVVRHKRLCSTILIGGLLKISNSAWQPVLQTQTILIRIRILLFTLIPIRIRIMLSYRFKEVMYLKQYFYTSLLDFPC